MAHPTISVIIPAYNASKTIRANIQAILDQTHSPYEIIIVDDGSIDNTAAIIQSFSNVKYIYQDNAGPATARNTGAKAATGDVLFFTDSDCVPNQDWLAKAISGFEESGVGVVCGSYDIANADSILARGIHAEILYRHHHLMPERPKAFGSYNFGVKKNVFFEVGGFSEQYAQASGEDNDLSYKIRKAGYDIYFQKAALVKHHHPTKVMRYLKEQFRHGYWRAKMYGDHPEYMQGDDYTFWKDMWEIPLSAGVLLGVVAVLFGAPIFYALIFSLLLYLIEVYYSFVTRISFFDAIFYSYVLFFRAFARMLGFSTGVLYFFCKNIGKKR